MLRYTPLFNLKTTTYTLLLTCTVCLFVHCAAAQRTDTNNLLSTIVIDAGHGGKDPGTEGKNSQEKNVTLAVALKLGKLVREAYPDLKVVFTRETDEFIELNQRTAIANECKADLFISIHCNAAASTAAVGTETFVMGLHTSKSNLEVAQRENSVISYEADYSTKYEGYDPKSPESFMIFSLMQNVFLDQSLELATGIQGQFTSQLQRFDRGVKQAGFLVLYKSSMPSVLIELGFLSNPKEEKYLLSEKGQQELAKAIFNAFAAYKKKWDAHASQPLVVIRPPEPKKVDTTPPPSAKKDSLRNSNNATGKNVAKSNPEGKGKGKTPASGRRYRIQVATLSNSIPPQHRLHKLYPDLRERKEGKLYRYYTGEYTDIEAAKTHLVKVRRNFPDAFLVAFEGEKKVAI